MAEFVTVAKTTEIPAGQGHIVQAGDKQVALFNIDGSFYAIENVCPHRGGPVGEGDLQGKVITCPWHGWSFDVTTCQGVANPGSHCSGLRVQVEGESVQVAV